MISGRSAKVDDKIKVIDFSPLPAQNSFKQFESTGTIKRIKDDTQILNHTLNPGIQVQLILTMRS
ncbi:hypothetical protein ACV566_09845 [Staphylococcus aureus]